ncbi:hypothetical protein JKP88DRAFT_222916 [Tribonema minus]|uniref:Uncharacterized protein n=1 Tax=Tribonema minus TaxID=303371 RepID=A0A835YU02_9STRA|nr:hypothetical protein JKP88DRAFT_222916 [Tribonema minus]
MTTWRQRTRKRPMTTLSRKLLLLLLLLLLLPDTLPVTEARTHLHMGMSRSEVCNFILTVKRAKRAGSWLAGDEG